MTTRKGYGPQPGYETWSEPGNPETDTTGIPSDNVEDYLPKTETHLTPDECNKLVCFILMTTNYRKGEAEAWNELSEVINKETGLPAYPYAKSNAKYWEKLEIELKKIAEKLEIIDSEERRKRR